MTPLSRFFGRWLRSPLNWVALFTVYAFMLLAVIAHIGYDAPANVYIDIGR